MGKGTAFTENTHAILKQFLLTGPSGNRWFKVNLHVHAEGSKPSDIVKQARDAEIDLLAITDHQSFNYYDAVATAASTSGRLLVVLPGIEITSVEGVHVLALFPADFTATHRTRLIGWLEIPGTGETGVASRKLLLDILRKVDEESGIIVVPHPFAEKIGLLDSARKISTKVEWLESGHIHLMQLSPEVDDKVRHYAWDAEGNWINRFVLSSASVPQIEESTYCLAPMNRSDAHKPAEIPDGCSWFRMSEASVPGLEQVACEPWTRISRKPPKKDNVDCILGVRVKGGYCDGQAFMFNECLNCIIGPNHAGKSAVLDFIRFALTDEKRLQLDVKSQLLSRLNAILGVGGQVEVYARQSGDLYAVRRTFTPTVNSTRPSEITGCSEGAHAYKLDGGELVPVDWFRMAVEVYEQGRISRLRDDAARQLEMLDEFANLGGLIQSRSDTVSKLNTSGEELAPLYEERDDLQSKVSSLPDLKAQLAQMEKLTPGEEEKRWGRANTAVEGLLGRIEDLEGISEDIPDGTTETPEGDLERLFAQEMPSYDPTKGAEPELLADWRAALKTALGEIAAARAGISSAIQALIARSRALQKKWTKAHDEYERDISRRLSEVGVESPKEVIERVKKLQIQIDEIEGAKQRRLTQVSKAITKGEGEREALLSQLERLGKDIRGKREEKARDLTAMLDDQIRISIAPSGDSTAYRHVLHDLCQKGTTTGGRLRNRESQIEAIVSRLTPLTLARALRNGGVVISADGSKKPLHQFCSGVTEACAKALLSAASDIQVLNSLECVTVPDVPVIMVRRRGETTYGDLRTGLSPGEQSAALLTVALQTRTMPLILDQPEDELGYSYVVHLVIPKILRAKVSRQLLVVTHNANIPVLGDADYVTRMENRPGGPNVRACVIDQAGCFESPTVTAALLDLEGGAQAFQFRNHRYALRK
jgi:AAA domain-containing protein